MDKDSSQNSKCETIKMARSHIKTQLQRPYKKTVSSRTNTTTSPKKLSYQSQIVRPLNSEKIYLACVQIIYTNSTEMHENRESSIYYIINRTAIVNV